MGKKCVFIIEDNLLFAESLVSIINKSDYFEVVGTATNAPSACTKVGGPNIHIDLVLINIDLPSTGGLQVLLYLRKKSSSFNGQILMLSMYKDGYNAALALERGASGYLLKSTVSQTLIDVMYVIMDGYTFVSEEVYTLMCANGIAESITQECFTIENDETETPSIDTTQIISTDDKSKVYEKNITDTQRLLSS